MARVKLWDIKTSVTSGLSGRKVWVGRRQEFMAGEILFMILFDSTGQGTFGQFHRIHKTDTQCPVDFG